jgi:hypothetical protein
VGTADRAAALDTQQLHCRAVGDIRAEHYLCGRVVPGGRKFLVEAKRMNTKMLECLVGQFLEAVNEKPEEYSPGGRKIAKDAANELKNILQYAELGRLAVEAIKCHCDGKYEPPGELNNECECCIMAIVCRKRAELEGK